eukprot:814365-Alexandrium_andersonii.AAC.1
MRSRRPRRPRSRGPTAPWRTPSSSSKGWSAPSRWRFRRGSRGGACGPPGNALAERACRRAADEAPGGPRWPYGLLAPFRQALP